MNKELHGASRGMKKKEMARDEGLGNVEKEMLRESPCGLGTGRR